jgi:tetratricopeptide (TPR) repeat protein
LIQIVAALIVLIVGFAADNAQTDDDAAAIMQAANAAYTNGEFILAIEIYEGLLASGIDDAALHFNLAHAYTETGDLAPALLHYHRARQRAPRDVDVRVSLERARQQAPSGGADWTQIPAQIAGFTESLATVEELAFGVLILWLVWCISLLGLLLNQAARDRWRVPVVMLTIPFVIGMAALTARVDVATNQALVIAMQPGMAMSGPGADYLTLFDVPVATEARLLEVRADWGRIILPSGRQGWLPLHLIERV